MLLLREERTGRGNINYKDLLEGMNLSQPRQARDAWVKLEGLEVEEVGSD